MLVYPNFLSFYIYFTLIFSIRFIFYPLIFSFLLYSFYKTDCKGTKKIGHTQPFLQLFYVLLPNFYVLLHLYAKFQVCQFFHLHHPQTSISPSPKNPVNPRFHRIKSTNNQGQFCPTTHQSGLFLCNTVQQSGSFLCNTVHQSGSFFVQHELSCILSRSKHDIAPNDTPNIPIGYPKDTALILQK